MKYKKEQFLAHVLIYLIFRSFYKILNLPGLDKQVIISTIHIQFGVGQTESDSPKY